MSAQARGAVAAGHKLTAETAADILTAGGNAFDATIAAAWMACVCEPVLASPGGGGFAMVQPGGGTARLYDFFAQTPLNKISDPEYFEVHADFGEAKQAFHIGTGASATPGFVPGLFALHNNLATLPMADLIAPAAHAARNGVAVTRFQHFLSTVVAPILLASEKSRALFAPGGSLIAAGETFTNGGLAGLFDVFAASGLSVYEQSLRLDMTAEQQRGGHLKADDFAAYQTIERQPLQIRIGTLDIALNPAPSAGGVLIAHTLSAMDELTPLELARALDRTDRERRRCAGDLNTLMADLGPASYRGTTHISVVGASGDACAMTLSNGEGNGHIVADHGFMLNNMLGEEDVNPAGATGWPANCRLSSIMCPTIVKNSDGKLIALGSGGSNRIRSAIATVLCALANHPDRITASAGAPRMHIEAGHLDMEGQFDPQVLNALMSAFPDHRVWPEPNLFFGGCHIAARRGEGTFTGAGDDRRGGVCLTV